MGKAFIMGGKVGMKKPSASRLPSGYTELACIQGSGTQYIDTGFTPDQDTRIDMVVAPTSVADAAGNGVGFIPYGAAVSYNSRAYECYSQSSQYEFNYGTQNAFIGSAVADQVIAISHNKNAVSVEANGVVSSHTFTYAAFTAPYKMVLFGINRGSAICGSMKLYSCQIYDNDTLIRDFVPCISDADGVGLFDLVNNQFYGNAGSGSFTGSEVA